MTKYPDDERTPAQLEKKMALLSGWLSGGTILTATQMRVIRLFLKRHGITLPKRAETTGEQP